METDFAFYALAVPAVIFAGVSKGGFGSTASFAAAPFLALIVEPAVAVGIMLPLLMLMDVTALRPFWRRWDWPAARRLVLGAVPGVLLGTMLIAAAEPDVFRFLIGALALTFVGYRLLDERGWLRRAARPIPAGGGVLLGLVAGFTSFVSHAGGPPAAVYLLSLNLGKTAFQATTVLVFWVVNIFKIGPYIALGFVGGEALVTVVILAPAAILGVALGVHAHRVLPERIFFALTYLFLTATGVKLIWDAVT